MPGSALRPVNGALLVIPRSQLVTKARDTLAVQPTHSRGQPDAACAKSFTNLPCTMRILHVLLEFSTRVQHRHYGTTRFAFRKSLLRAEEAIAVPS